MPKEMEVKAFLEVCRKLNFTKAAESLFLSQQCCSRYVRNLEKEVGFLLLIRTTRHVELTPEGDMLFQALDEAAHSYETVLRIGRAKACREKSIVRVGVMNMTSMDFIAERYQQFCQKYGEVSVQWTYRDPGYIQHLLMEDEIDLAILHLISDSAGSDLFHNPQYRTMRMKDCKMYLKYSRFHPLSSSAQCPEDFDKAVVSTFLHYGESISDEVFRTKRRLEEFGLRNNIVRVFDTMEESNISVQLGESVCIASELSLFLNEPDMQNMYLGEGRPLSCIWKVGTENSYVRLLVDTLTTGSEQ